MCGISVAGAALAELSWSTLAAADAAAQTRELRRRKPLVVKPVFTYPLATPRPQTSWRNWGGVQTQADVEQEAARIRGELDRLQAAADFPVEFLPLAVVRRADELRQAADLAAADALLVYAAGDGGGDLMAAMNPLHTLGKDLIFFVRHKSGPVYYWYEGIMARYLHQHTDDVGRAGRRLRRRGGRSAGRGPVAAAGPVRAEEHAADEDRRDRPRRRLGTERQAGPRTGASRSGRSTSRPSRTTNWAR